LPATKYPDVSNESADESASDEVDPQSTDEHEADAVEWDSDDLDELAEDDAESTEEVAEQALEQAPQDNPLSAAPPKKKLKPLSKQKLAESRTAIQNTGVLYLSRIPPKLNPTKIRQLLSVFDSPVLRIFLAPESEVVYRRRIKSGDNKKRQFTEGWVEFAEKKVAKKVALMLNAERIGGRKGDKWYDDLWNLKYLPRFKWHHLTEQIGTPPARSCPFILSLDSVFYLCFGCLANW
jgi:ESF2/ABP1 family protein